MKLNFAVKALLSISFLFIIISISGVVIIAQKSENYGGKHDFCSGNRNSWGNKSSFQELREVTISAGALNVDAGKNGGISVRGENRSDILVRACVQTWGDTDEQARKIGAGVKIETSPNVHASGIDGEAGGGVSYEILVPNSTDVNLKTINGGVVINSVEGNIQFEARNGGVVLKNLAGSVQGKTSNGGIVVALAGSTWRGSGMDVQTTNGGVKVSMADNYAARIVTGTVNGGFKSEVAGITVTSSDEKRGGWARNQRVDATINGGGPTVSITTVNGGVKIDAEDKDN
jgi:hypothetical protein